MNHTASPLILSGTGPKSIAVGSIRSDKWAMSSYADTRSAVLQAMELRDEFADVRDEAESRVLAMLEELEAAGASDQGPAGGASDASDGGHPYPSSPVATSPNGLTLQHGSPTTREHI